MKSTWKATIPTLALMSVIGLVAVYFHEWWRDEARTWLVFQNSHSVRELVHNLGFDGHPKFYYVLNYALIQLVPKQWALSVLNLFLAVTGVGFLMISAPLTNLQKFLFALGFFPLYQYGVITRSYSLFIVLLFAYCYLKSAHPRLLAWRVTALVFLAQTQLVAAALVPVLWGMDCWQDRCQARRPQQPFSAKRWLGSAILILSLGLAALQIIPPGTQKQVRTFGSIGTAFLGFSHAFWPNFGMFMHVHIFKLFEASAFMVGIILWIFSWRIFKGRPLGLLYYLLLSVTLFGILSIIYSGHRWHHGLYFIFFIVAIWLSASQPYEDRFSRRYITGVLSLHVAIGGYAITADIMHPYSNGKAVAQFIQSHKLENMPLVGMSIFREDQLETTYSWEISNIQPVLMYLNFKEIYNPLTARTEPYWKHYSEPDYFPHLTYLGMKQELQGIASQLRQPFLIIVSHEQDIKQNDLPDPLQKISVFPMPTDYGERLGLYFYNPDIMATDHPTLVQHSSVAEASSPAN